MSKRYKNTIYKPFLKNKKTIKAILSSIIRIKLIIRIKDPKEAFGVNHIHIKKNTEVEKTTKADITTTSYPIKSDTTSIINLNAS